MLEKNADDDGGAEKQRNQKTTKCKGSTQRWPLTTHERPSTHLPVLLDVEAPLKLEMSLVVIVDELGNGVVVPTEHHTGWCGLRLELLLVIGLVGCVWSIRANHLLHLVADTHALDHLNVLHAGQDLMLYLETCLHAEDGAFLDGERLGFESLERIWSRDIDNNVRAAFNLGEYLN